MNKVWGKGKKITLLVALIVIAFLAVAINRQTKIGQKVTNDTVQDSIRNEDTTEKDCVLTLSDGQGPYYQTGSPTRDVLSPPSEEGEKLIMRGVVYNRNCEPVTNALLDVWHADSNGNYDDEWYRGKISVNDKGEYEFETVRPAAYGSSSNRRPAHIHYKVWVNGKEVLTSQMYFDEELVNEVGETRMVNLSRGNGMLLGNFDVVVDLSSN